MQPLSTIEINKIYRFIQALLGRASINVNRKYEVVFLDYRKLEKIRERSNILCVNDICLDPRGIILLNKEVLPNVAIKKVMLGMVLLAFLDNFGNINLKYANKLVEEYYDKVIVYLYKK